MAMSTMFPKFSKKREGDEVVMEQKLLQTTNKLVLDVKECAGCGICVEACPEEAITFGLVGAARRGAIDEPAVNVDEEKCSYCGVCVCLCPFSALSLRVDGEERLPIVEKEGFPQYDRTAKIDDEKCVKCTICSDVCPEDAIDRDVPEFEGSSEAGAARQGALKSSTTFTVDKEKCNLCGICAVVCKDIEIQRQTPTGASTKLEGDVNRISEKDCDACSVCVDLCPEKAITVERTVESNKLEGKVEIMPEDCITCTWCQVTCPEEAITMDKLIEGEIDVYAEKCPGGCSTCIEICPTKALYMPEAKPASEMAGEREANVAINKDLCIKCGACVVACPAEDAIVLKRTAFHMKGKETDLYKKILDKLCTPRTSKVKESTPGDTELKQVGKAEAA